MDKTGKSCEDVAKWVKQSIKEGKASSLKLDENIKAELLDDMIAVLSTAADKQVASSLYQTVIPTLKLNTVLSEAEGEQVARTLT